MAPLELDETKTFMEKETVYKTFMEEESEEEVGMCTANSDESNQLQEELYEVLKEGLLNNSENVQKIDMIFGEQPFFKICVQLSYFIINCTEKECNCSDNGTMSTYNITWASVDTATFSGRVLFWFAYINWDVFGFEWGNICNTSSTTYFNITALLPMLDKQNEEKNITTSLKKLTLQVQIISIIPYCTYTLQADHQTHNFILFILH